MAVVEFFSLQRQHAELRAALESAIARVLGAGYFILGAEVEKFEHDFAAYVGVKHAVGVGNGLEALGLLLKALRVGPGDEVIVPGHTFIATWLAAEQVGATVVPVDVDPVNYNIDPAQVRMAITSRTRAIIAVHLYGQPADMNSLDEISKEHGIPVLEDAAQAHGATLDGRKTGGLGLAAAFSFYPTKNLGALGDGGAVTTDDDALAASIRSLRNYGSSVKYRHDELGGNSRLDELQASFLNVKLAGLDDRNEKRRIIATRYSSKLSGVTGVAVPQVAKHASPVWHQYVIRLTRRAQVQAELNRRGIQTMIHYPIPPHLQRAYATNPVSRVYLPHTERAAEQVLSLPMWPELSDAEVDGVIGAVKDAVLTVEESPAEI
jgi:dTDP-3-amino-3,4,6-trideoxy-alpha-D-glucose transaminase